MLLFTQIKKDRKSIAWGKDIFAGVVVALVSIPISMGYAQIAGLPPVYGLYGSLLPILLYGLLFDRNWVNIIMSGLEKAEVL